MEAAINQPIGSTGAPASGTPSATLNFNNSAYMPGWRMSGMSLLKVFLFFVAVQVIAIWVASKVVK